MPLRPSLYKKLKGLETASLDPFCKFEEYEGKETSNKGTDMINLMKTVALLADDEGGAQIAEESRRVLKYTPGEFNKVVHMFFEYYSRLFTKKMTTAEIVTALAGKYLEPGDVFKKILGAGKYGVVIMVERGGVDVAVKFARGKFLRLFSEVYAQMQFAKAGMGPSVHLIQAYAAPGKNQVLLVFSMDTVDYTLHQLLCAAGDNQERVDELVQHVVNLLKMLHQNRMTHGDFHFKNIAFVVGKDKRVQPRLIDFGFSDWTGSNLATDVEYILSTLRAFEYPYTLKFASAIKKMYEEDPSIPSHVLNTDMEHNAEFHKKYRVNQVRNITSDKIAMQFIINMKRHVDAQQRAHREAEYETEGRAEEKDDGGAGEVESVAEQALVPVPAPRSRSPSPVPAPVPHPRSPSPVPAPVPVPVPRQQPKPKKRQQLHRDDFAMSLNTATGKYRKKCAKGYSRNRVTGRCRKKCGKGFSRSRSSGRCRKSCGEGYTRSKQNGRCLKKCGPGYSRNKETQRCRKRK